MEGQKTPEESCGSTTEGYYASVGENVDIREGKGDDSSEDCSGSTDEHPISDHTRITRSHSQTRYAGGTRRGRARIARGRGTRWHGGGGRGSSYTSCIPATAVSIEEKDVGFQECEEFSPLRDPGPQLCKDTLSQLDLFRLYFNDKVIERLVKATIAYAESKKDQKPAMHKRFNFSPLTTEEMMRLIGVLLILSMHSTRSYRHAWNPNSLQVGV